MNILYLLLFYSPTKFCQLDTEVHRKTQSTFIGAIILRAIQLCLNASVRLSFLWKPLLQQFILETGQGLFSIYLLPLILLSLECGLVRILCNTNCLDTNLLKLNSQATDRCPGLMYKGLEMMSYLNYFPNHQHEMSNLCLYYANSALQILFYGE